jgi:hypothetical protein
MLGYLTESPYLYGFLALLLAAIVGLAIWKRADVGISLSHAGFRLRSVAAKNRPPGRARTFVLNKATLQDAEIDEIIGIEHTNHTSVPNEQDTSVLNQAAIRRAKFKRIVGSTSKGNKR